MSLVAETLAKHEQQLSQEHPSLRPTLLLVFLSTCLVELRLCPHK